MRIDQDSPAGDVACATSHQLALREQLLQHGDHQASITHRRLHAQVPHVLPFLLPCLLQYQGPSWTPRVPWGRSQAVPAWPGAVKNSGSTMVFTPYLPGSLNVTAPPLPPFPFPSLARSVPPDHGWWCQQKTGRSDFLACMRTLVASHVGICARCDLPNTARDAL